MKTWCTGRPSVESNAMPWGENVKENVKASGLSLSPTPPIPFLPWPAPSVSNFVVRCTT